MVNSNILKTEERIFRHDLKFPLLVFLQDPQVVTCSHRHEFTECAIVIRGKGMHQSKQRAVVPIQRGDIIVIPIDGDHGYSLTDDLAVINLVFDTEKLPPVLMELYTHPAYKRLFLRNLAYYEDRDFPIFHPDDDTFREIEFFAERFVATCDRPGNHCAKLGLFMVLLTQLCNADMQEEEENRLVPLNIPKLTAFLEQNFHRKIYLEELCRLCAMSRATLLRHFQAALGATPIEYLRTIRLRHVADMLLNTDFTLQEIASRCGFPADAYFFRAFKKNYGISPQLYRRRVQNTSL